MPKTHQTHRKATKVPTKKPSRASKKSDVASPRLIQACFAIVFAALAALFISFTFAATAQTSFSGTLSKKQPVRTHSISTSVPGTITASATTTKAGASLTLKLKQGATLIAQNTAASPTISAPVSSGSFSLEVSASVNSPTQYTLSVTYPVPDPQPVQDTTPPTAPAGLTAYLSTTTASPSVNLSWQSATDNVGVSAYDIYRNNVLISTSMTTTYNDVNLAPSTTYTYYVKAKDAAGNVSVASNSSSVTTPAAADTTAPNVTITTPVSGATVSGTVTVAGTASDNTSLSRVDIQLDSSGFVPASGTTNWTYSLNTSLYANGTHTFTAKATDGAGNSKTTAISVNIQNSTGGATAPNTQGTWTSPEGAKFEISSTVCPVTLSQFYAAFIRQVQGPGDYATIAPTLWVSINDSWGTATAAGAGRSGDGPYQNYSAHINFNGDAGHTICSNGVFNPDITNLPHEYGHAWTLYHLYINHNGSASKYFNYRWANADGSVKIGQDSRLGSSYSWDPYEMLAEDFRRLYGVGPGQQSTILNRDIPDAVQQPGLKNWFDTVWKVHD